MPATVTSWFLFQVSYCSRDACYLSYFNHLSQWKIAVDAASPFLALTAAAEITPSLAVH